MWALLEVTLLSYFPVIIAPPLDPTGEAPEAIQVDAGGLIKEVLDVGHKVQQMSLLNLQCFLLVLEEVVKEPLLDPGPVPLHKQLNTVPVVDPEDVLQVLPRSTATKVCCQPHGITEGRPCPTSLLSLGSFRCWQWWWWWWWGTRRQSRGQNTLLTWQLHTHHPWYTSWVTDGSAAVSPPSHCRPSMVLRHATHRSGFICGGVSNDSPPHRPLWWLHRLLVGHSGPLRVWLLDRHRLRCTRHHCGWRWHSLSQSAWAGCSRNPLHCAPESSRPPNPREVWWGWGSSRCESPRKR